MYDDFNWIILSFNVADISNFNLFVHTGLIELPR